MRLFDLIMYILGALCFLAEVVISHRNAPRRSTVNLVALGLLFWILVPLVAVANTYTN